MRLTEILSKPFIKVPLTGTTRRAVLRELVELVLPDWDESVRDSCFDSVLERELVMTTGIGSGIALPHGDAPATVGIAAGLGIPKHPLDFAAVDHEPVNLIFLLLVDPEEPIIRLQALARISRLLHREPFRLALAGCETATDAMRVITAEEARHRI